MSTMAQEESPLVDLIPRLTPKDQCDRCGAQARLAVLLSAGSESILLFCMHHANEYEPKFIGALAIRDIRQALITAETGGN